MQSIIDNCVRLQSAQPSASILQSVLAWQQQRSAAAQPQTVRDASLQAAGSQHQHSMPHPKHGFAAMPPAAPPVQRQPGGGGGLMLPWILPAPQLTAVAPAAYFPPPLPALPAAYAGQLLSAQQPRGAEQFPRWQPDPADNTARMPAALRQGLPRTPQPSAVEAPQLPGTFGAFRLPAPAGGASAFTPGFPPLPAALQRRHTWSNVTGSSADLAAAAALAAPMVGLAPHQPSGFGVWPPQYVHEQVMHSVLSPRHLP